MKLTCLRTAAAVALLGLAAFSTASAETHGAHVHGEADIAVVIEGATVSVSIMSAMYNITGFEHAPETEEQHDILEAAIGWLDDGAALFEFNESRRHRERAASWATRPIRSRSISSNPMTIAEASGPTG